MTHHGIDPSQQTITQFVQFCKRLESTKNIPSGNGMDHGYGNKKDENTHGQLAETANAEPSATVLVGRQTISIELNVEKETTLPTDVG